MTPRPAHGGERVRHIVALSGGKDSTALALALAEKEPRQYEYVCTPTGNELPEMRGHWRRVGALLGQAIVYLHTSDRDTLESLIRQFRMLPNGRARWCTRILKIEPFIDYLEAAAPAVAYVGLRADEPPDMREGGVYDQVPNVAQRFPLREWGWTVDDVWSFLGERGVEIPRRTDCALCYHQRIGEWWNLYRDHPDELTRGIELEGFVAAERGKAHTFRNPSRDSWPASLTELREVFRQGRVPAGADVQGDMFGRDSICRACTL